MNRCINKICVPISSIFYALFAVKTVIFLLFSFLQCPGYDFLFFMLYQNEYYTHYFAFQVITSFISSRFGMDYKNYCYHCTTISIILFVSFPLFVSIFCWFDFFLSLPFNPLWLLLKYYFAYFLGFIIVQDKNESNTKTCIADIIYTAVHKHQQQFVTLSMHRNSCTGLGWTLNTFETNNCC